MEEGADRMDGLSFRGETQLPEPPRRAAHAPVVLAIGDNRITTIDGGTYWLRPAPDRRRAVASVRPYAERRAVLR